MNQYDWRWWFAWYPVQGAKWLRWNQYRAIGVVAPNGDLFTNYEYRNG